MMIRLRKELGHGKKKIAKMLSTKQKGWEWQRGAEATKMKHQKKEAKRTGGEGRSQCRKQLMKREGSGQKGVSEARGYRGGVKAQ